MSAEERQQKIALEKVMPKLTNRFCNGQVLLKVEAIPSTKRIYSYNPHLETDQQNAEAHKQSIRKPAKTKTKIKAKTKSIKATNSTFGTDIDLSLFDSLNNNDALNTPQKTGR